MATAAKTENGGCLCGRVRYRIQTGAKRQVTHCHCTICRRASGALFMTWVTVLSSGFEWIRGNDNAASTEAQVYCSSSGAKRFFCRDCGTALAFQHEDTPQELDVTAGSLENNSEISADYHGFVGSKVAGIHVDEHLPSYEHDPPSDWIRQP